MAKNTFLRQVNTQAVTGISEKAYAAYDFTGINDSENYTDVDQYSFADANNVFVDGDDRLSTRPPLKTIVVQDFDVEDVVDVQKVDDVVFYILKDNSIYWKYNDTWWPYDGLVGKDIDKVKIFSYDNYFLIFTVSDDTIDIKAIKYNYDTNLFDEYDADDLIYIPATTVIYGTTVNVETESKNILTNKSKVRYIFNAEVYTPSEEIVGETVKITVGNDTYTLVWKEEYASQMPAKVGVIRGITTIANISNTFFKEDTIIVQCTINDTPYILYSFNGDVWGRIEYPVDYNDSIQITLSEDGTEIWLFDFSLTYFANGTGVVDTEAYYLTLSTDVSDVTQYGWNSIAISKTFDYTNYNKLFIRAVDGGYNCYGIADPSPILEFENKVPFKIYSRESGNCIITFFNIGIVGGRKLTHTVDEESTDLFSVGDTVYPSSGNVSNSSTAVCMYLVIINDYTVKNIDYYDGSYYSNVNVDKMLISAVNTGSSEHMINFCNILNNGKGEILTILCTEDWIPIANYANESNTTIPIKTCIQTDTIYTDDSDGWKQGPYPSISYLDFTSLYKVPTFIGETMDEVINKLEYQFQNNYSLGIFYLNVLMYLYTSSDVGYDTVFNTTITNPSTDAYYSNIQQFFTTTYTSTNLYTINAADVTALTTAIQEVGDVPESGVGYSPELYHAIYKYNEGEYSLSRRFYIYNYIADMLSVYVITDKYYYYDHATYDYMSYMLNPDITIYPLGITGNGSIYYYDSDGNVYTNNFTDDWYVDYMDPYLTNTIVIPEFIDAFITHTFVYNNLLYQTNNMTMEDDNCLLYIPENSKVVLPDTITGTAMFSQTVLALFTEHTAYEYTYDDETGYFQLYPTKLQLGNRKDYDICTAFDGLTIYLATLFGYKSLTYESFIQSTEQAFTDCCANIYNKFIEFDDAPIKQAKYNYWIFLYKEGDNNILVYDTRQNLDDYYNPLYPKWFRWTLPCKIKELYYDGRDCYVFTGDTVYLLDFSSIDVMELGQHIDWFIRSQKLHFNYPAYYKHVSTLTVLTSQGSDVRYKLKFTNYHNAYDTEHTDVKEYQVETVGVCVKRVNFLKINALQYEISNDDTDDNPKKFAISGINIKYRVTENVR